MNKELLIEMIEEYGEAMISSGESSYDNSEDVLKKIKDYLFMASDSWTKPEQFTQKRERAKKSYLEGIE